MTGSLIRWVSVMVCRKMTVFALTCSGSRAREGAPIFLWEAKNHLSARRHFLSLSVA
jgi:hypothetical protein